MKMKMIITTHLAVLAVLFLSTAAYAESFEFEHLTDYMDGNWIVAGIVRNNTATSVQFVSIELQGEDTHGNLVLTDTTYTFSPIPAGEAIPFRFVNRAEHAAAVTYYKVRVADYSKWGTDTFNFDFEQFGITEANNVYHKWSSRITNLSGQTRKFVEVALMGFDKSGNLVCVETSYPNSSTLDPDASSVIDIMLRPHLSQQIEKYQVIAYSGN